jgi:hypothetical protein
VIGRLRRTGHSDLADAVENGERSLYGVQVALGWRKPEPARRKPAIANGEAAPVTRRRPLRFPSPLDNDPRVVNLPEDRKAKTRRLARHDLALAERVLAGEVSLHRALIEAGLVKEPPPPPPPPAATSAPTWMPRSEEPVDEQIRDELAEAMGREARAAAAIDAHRQRRLQSEPPPRWTSGTWPPPEIEPEMAMEA